MGRKILYTGDGEGKTMAAIGHAIRAEGQNKKVVVIQFMKGRRDVGEYALGSTLFEMHQFGRKELVNLKAPSDEDRKFAREGMHKAGAVLYEKPYLIILDEVATAIAAGLVYVGDLQALIKAMPDETHLLLTGRKASKELIEIADQVTEFNNVKHPFKAGAEAEEGLDF